MTLRCKKGALTYRADPPFDFPVQFLESRVSLPRSSSEAAREQSQSRRPSSGDCFDFAWFSGRNLARALEKCAL
jgi:hypothetical protein